MTDDEAIRKYVAENAKNIVAEYCFNRLDERVYQVIMDRQDPLGLAELKKFERYCNRAIDLGLTYEDYLNDNDRAQAIWNKVEQEENIREWFG